MFKARFFLEAIENKNTEQITFAKAESYRLITDDSIIVHYFNKAFFELIKKYDEKNISGQISFSENKKYKLKSYFIPSNAADIFIKHLENGMFSKSKFCPCDIDIKPFFYFLLHNKDKCESFRISFYPATIEELAEKCSETK